MKHVDNAKDPIAPEIVFLGLIFVSFFPFTVFPMTKPPISEKTQVNSIKKIKIFKNKDEESVKNKIQK